MKGQVEFFVILGLLFIVVVVVFYGYMSGWFGSPIPDAVAQQQSTIRASFENFVRNGAYSVISTVSDRGGYLYTDSYPIGSVEFNGKDIPYWQYFGQTEYPDVLENIKTGLLNYIEENKDDFFDTATDAQLNIGDVSSITMTTTDNQITFAVYMPLSIVVDDVSYAFSQPVSVTVQTNMGQVANFANAFTYSQATDRFFETFTMASMLISPLDAEPPGGVHGVPVFISLSDCGQIVLRTWFDIEPNMENLLHKLVANTYLPGKSPRNNMNTSSAPEYEIPTLNGNYYSDLKVSFDLPEDFELTPLNFQFSPDPVYAYAKPLAFTGVCVSDPILINYSLSYPLVVSIRDKLTGSVFSFANTVFIQDNDATPWATIPGYGQSALQEICSGRGCSAMITVRASNGDPLSGASVSYFGCPIGKTNAEGVLDAYTPCGVGTLRVYKRGYGSFEDSYPSSGLEGLTITIARVPYKNVYLYEVNVVNLSLAKTYMISANDVGPLNTLYNHDDEVANLKFYATTDEYYNMIYDMMSGQLSTVPAGSYSVSGVLSKSNYQTMYGAFFADYTLSEDDGDLYVYLPYSPGFKDITSVEKQVEDMARMYSLLAKCGLGPISDTPVHEGFEGCAKDYNEL